LFHFLAQDIDLTEKLSTRSLGRLSQSLPVEQLKFLAISKEILASTIDHLEHNNSGDVKEFKFAILSTIANREANLSIESLHHYLQESAGDIELEYLKEVMY